VHSVSKSLAEHGAKLDAPAKEKIETALKEAEEAIKGDDKAAIEVKTEALMAASQTLGEKVYAEAQAAQQSAAGAGAPGQGAPQQGESREHAAADDNVVDAEFKEVKKG
jgi:molecular chaperone DnaK